MDKPGIQGLVLVVCGPTMNTPSAFNDVVGLVSDGVFSFALGFSTQNLIPNRVASPLVDFIQAAFVAQDKILHSVIYSFGGRIESLDHSPVVLIVREEGKAVARQVTFGPQTSRPWGLAPPQCPNCDSLTGAVSDPKYHSGAGPKEYEWLRHSCFDCGVHFKVTKPDSVQSVGLGHLRFVFVMPYPPPALVADPDEGVVFDDDAAPDVLEAGVALVPSDRLLIDAPVDPVPSSSVVVGAPDLVVRPVAVGSVREKRTRSPVDRIESSVLSELPNGKGEAKAKQMVDSPLVPEVVLDTLSSCLATERHSKKRIRVHRVSKGGDKPSNVA